MSDTETAANTAGAVAKEIVKVATIEAAVTAAEVVAAITILLGVGLVAAKLQERKAKKNALTVVPE